MVQPPPGQEDPRQFQGDNCDPGEPGRTGGGDCEGAQGEVIGILETELTYM